MVDVNLYTIGFTKKNAEEFFDLLRKNNIKKIVDVRLNNTSQLAAFTKKDDLTFFLKELCNAEYLHMPLLSPTKQILDDYKKNKGDWATYVKQFNELITERKIENQFTAEDLDHVCLLCSESTSKNCHRRLVAEHLQKAYRNVKINHL